MSNFQPLEVVGRESETQRQVAENLKKYNIKDKVNMSVSVIVGTCTHHRKHEPSC